MAAPKKVSNTPVPRPAGQVLIPATAIALLSIILTVGLESLGRIKMLNYAIARTLTQETSFPNELPRWAVWLAVVFCAFGLSFALLNIPTTWRRMVLWISALLVVAAWAPVLTLAARPPEISAALVATLWSGVCALVYAGRHQMRCDEIPEEKIHETR
jgi:hypothetical protein